MKTNKDIRNIICIIVIMFMALTLFHDIVGTSIFGASVYDSYSKQANAWLSGHTYLPENYTWLELAVYEDHYYVSFPPFPSVVMLPFVLIFGENTPSNAVIAAVVIATACIVYKILRKREINEYAAMFFAIFFSFGSNMFAMALNGGVWFMAQALNSLLCVLAVKFAIEDKRMLSYIMLGLAVGCRPFSAVYIVLLFVMYIVRDVKKYNFNKKVIINNIVAALPLVVIAAGYMIYNYVRFDNPLEFGHNYLPEFTESEHGQFNLCYLFPNLGNYLFRIIQVEPSLNITFEKFDGFLFYIANPIFLIVLYRGIRNIVKKNISWEKVGILFAMALNIVFLCCHKTLGGWQFGARYTCDMIPFALYYIWLSYNGEKTLPSVEGESQPQYTLTFCRTEIVIMVFGILFNLMGAVEYWLDLI